MKISGNAVGNVAPIKTLAIQDASGNEYVGVVVGSEVIFTATDTQVADGYVYAGDDGVSTGSREFLSFRTTQKKHLILPGESFSIPLEQYDKYNYTQLQCIIAKYTEDESERMAAERVVIGDKVYDVNSSVSLSGVTKNADTKSIDLNIANDTEDTFIVYLFTYKEEEL